MTPAPPRRGRLGAACIPLPPPDPSEPTPRRSIDARSHHPGTGALTRTPPPCRPPPPAPRHCPDPLGRRAEQAKGSGAKRGQARRRPAPELKGGAPVHGRAAGGMRLGLGPALGRRADGGALRARCGPALCPAAGWRRASVSSCASGSGGSGFNPAPGGGSGRATVTRVYRADPDILQADADRLKRNVRGTFAGRNEGCGGSGVLQLLVAPDWAQLPTGVRLPRLGEAQEPGPVLAALGGHLQVRPVCCGVAVLRPAVPQSPVCCGVAVLKPAVPQSLSA